ncbi:MAG TPA: hypothetical protein VFQ91_16670 [Bryobacteraceae bacterium]|nr:hypothetical protein [Bryobacteraceae bacterium]
MPLCPTRLRFHLEATTPIFFPPLKAENIWRGMAGLLLPRVAPAAAPSLLNPHWSQAPSGYATPPKPFLFRAFHLDGQRFQPGQLLHIDVHVFAPRLPIRESLEGAICLLETEGLGPGRGKLRLTGITESAFGSRTQPLRNELTIDLLTPTNCSPAYDTFLPRLRERINALTACYTSEPLLPPLPHNSGITLANDQTTLTPRARYSTRTGQTYGTGGRTGTFTYQGDLAAALPILRLGEATGLAGGWFQMIE